MAFKSVEKESGQYLNEIDEIDEDEPYEFQLNAIDRENYYYDKKVDFSHNFTRHCVHYVHNVQWG